MTDELRFSQQFIGILGAVSSGGWIAGALLYRWRLRGMTSQALLYLSIACGTAATLLFLLLADPVAAIVVNFLAGIAGMFLGGCLTDSLTRRIGLRWGRALPMALTRFVAAGARSNRTMDSA